MSEVTARALARSSLHMNAMQIVQMASRLVLTPIVIGRLGLEGYGVWVLLFTVCSSATAINSGVYLAYVKITAELDERRDYVSMTQVISSGMALMTIFSATVLGAIWLLRGSLLPTLGVPPLLQADAGRVLGLLSLAILVETGAGCTSYVLAGLQRMDLQYRFKLTGLVVELAVDILLLLTGYGMASLAAGYLAGGVIAAVASRAACRHLRPTLALLPLRCSIAGLRQLMPIGFRLQSVVLLGTVARESVRLAISILFGAATLGMYQLADRVLLVARFPALALASPLMAAFSGIAASGQTEKGRRLFMQASTVTAIGAAFALTFAMLFADAILYAWTGHDLPDSAWTVRVLAPAEFVPLLAGVTIAALRAAGTVAFELRFATVSSVLTLLGIAVGNLIAGFAGSVVAIAIGRCLAALWFMWRLPVTWIVDRGAYLRRTMLWPILVVVPTMLAAQLTASALAHPSGRWGTLMLVVTLAGTTALPIAAIAWLALLSKQDRAALLRKE